MIGPHRALFALGMLRRGFSALLLISGGSCQPFTGPARASVSLAELEFADMSIRDSSALVIVARPADPTLELGSFRRVAVQVRTSAGDRETVEIWHEGGGRGTVYEGSFSTVAFSFVGAAGVQADALERKLRSRSLVPFVLNQGALLYLVITFDPMRVAQVATEVSRWPEASIVELVQGTIFEPFGTRNALAGPLRIAYGAPRSRDGVLQVAPGDTLWAQHIGPSGDTLRTMRIVPTVSP